MYFHLDRLKSKGIHSVIIHRAVSTGSTSSGEQTPAVCCFFYLLSILLAYLNCDYGNGYL